MIEQSTQEVLTQYATSFQNCNCRKTLVLQIAIKIDNAAIQQLLCFPKFSRIEFIMIIPSRNYSESMAIVIPSFFDIQFRQKSTSLVRYNVEKSVLPLKIIRIKLINVEHWHEVCTLNVNPEILNKINLLMICLTNKAKTHDHRRRIFRTIRKKNAVKYMRQMQTQCKP